MKIIVKEKSGMNLMIPFPTSLVSMVVCSRMAAKYIKRAQPSDSSQWLAGLSEESVCKFQKGLKKSLRKYKGLVLVEVESADGDYVKIQL